MKKFCEECGERLIEGGKFCQSCGSPIERKPQSSAPAFPVLGDLGWSQVGKPQKPISVPPIPGKAVLTQDGAPIIIGTVPSASGNKVLTQEELVEKDTTVKEDGTIEFSMEENPSTGFTHRYTLMPEDVLAVVDDRYISDPPPEGAGQFGMLCGGGGKRICRFRPVKDGRVTIRFVHARGIHEVLSDFLYTYEVKDGVATRVVEKSNYWICGCGIEQNRFTEFCGACKKANPELADAWYCEKCWKFVTKDRETCPDCGLPKTYDNSWICTCGHVIFGGRAQSCPSCRTMRPNYAGGWVCAHCGRFNRAVELCEKCGKPNDNSSGVWICECRHLNNWSKKPEDYSNICESCGKARPGVS